MTFLFITFNIFILCIFYSKDLLILINESKDEASQAYFENLERLSAFLSFLSVVHNWHCDIGND